jgi:hypothetical protein
LVSEWRPIITGGRSDIDKVAAPSAVVDTAVSRVEADTLAAEVGTPVAGAVHNRTGSAVVALPVVDTEVDIGVAHTENRIVGAGNS